MGRTLQGCEGGQNEIQLYIGYPRFQTSSYISHQCHQKVRWTSTRIIPEPSTTSTSDQSIGIGPEPRNWKDYRPRAPSKQRYSIPVQMERISKWRCDLPRCRTLQNVPLRHKSCEGVFVEFWWAAWGIDCLDGMHGLDEGCFRWMEEEWRKKRTFEEASAFFERGKDVRILPYFCVI